MFLDFERNIFGFVDFCAEGADFEKLLNYCAENKIEILSPRKKGYSFFGKIKAKDYKKLRIPARKAGIKLKIIKKRGLYFYLKNNKSKILFASGATVIVFFILFMNLFIWDIRVSGCKNIEPEIIIETAEKAGLKSGTFKQKPDVQLIEWDIIKNIEGIATAEINIQGCRATILINEAKEPAEMKSDDDVPVNIVASRYGVIRKMNVFDGQDAVKIGDAVMKGDLLVSAVYEDSHNKLTLKHARANVIAETDYCITAEFPLEQIIKSKGNLKKTIYEAEILGIDFKLGKQITTNNMIIEKEEKTLYFFWIKLPVKVTIYRCFDVKVNNITYNFEQARDGAEAILKEKEDIELENMEIISKTVNEKVKNNKYIITADYIVLMDIAKEQQIESDIPWENTDDMS